MQPHRRLITWAAAISLLLLVLGGWLVFAPVQLGGGTSYVIVTGNSMEPRLHAGDLALVRESSSYHVGEVVTYRHPDIGNVIHRILGKDDGLYLFRGDHNDFTDPYHPAEADLVGRLWISVPAIGGWLSHLRSPFVVAGLAIAAAAGVGMSTTANKKKKGHQGLQRAGWQPWRS
ncbi:MAG: signal peptidase I, partial [Anaerolineaceae bacterium]